MLFVVLKKSHILSFYITYMVQFCTCISVTPCIYTIKAAEDPFLGEMHSAYSIS